MPSVIVEFDSRVVSPRIAEELGDRLPAIVAQALTCTDSELDPLEVEVDVRPMSTYRQERADHCVNVVVDANDYPARRANLTPSTEKIFHAAEGYLKTMVKSPQPHMLTVWVRLHEADWMGSK